MTSKNPPSLPELAADFNRYFTSANDAAPNARVSVPTQEWQQLHAALLRTIGEPAGMQEVVLANGGAAYVAPDNECHPLRLAAYLDKKQLHLPETNGLTKAADQLRQLYAEVLRLQAGGAPAAEATSETTHADQRNMTTNTTELAIRLQHHADTHAEQLALDPHFPDKFGTQLRDEVFMDVTAPDGAILHSTDLRYLSDKLLNGALLDKPDLAAAGAAISHLLAWEGPRDAAAESTPGESPRAPEHCPITGMKFWGNMEHPELGTVALYGGPLDSYTIPHVDSEGELRCERYDQDAGEWVDGGHPVGWAYKNQRDNEPLTHGEPPASSKPEAKPISREEWLEQACQTYLLAGDDATLAKEQALYLWGQQDWLSGELEDPRAAAKEDIEGRPRPDYLGINFPAWFAAHRKLGKALSELAGVDKPEGLAVLLANLTQGFKELPEPRLPFSTPDQVVEQGGAGGVQGAPVDSVAQQVNQQGQ